MPTEDFSEKSSKAIWRLTSFMKLIMEDLKNDLPLEKLDWGWNLNEADEALTINIWGTGFTALNAFLIYFRPLDSSPEPKELYPSNCFAVGTLRTSLAEQLEICSSGDAWLVHNGDKWIPFSASYLAFLIGKAQHAPLTLPSE